MAMWKRLHRIGPEGNEIDVNMDAAVQIQRSGDSTTIYFSVATSDSVHTLNVRETPDEIHALIAL
jgi:hypothetical protein